MLPNENQFEVYGYTPDEKDGVVLSGLGLEFRGQAHRGSENLLAPETQTFAKWIRVNHPQVAVRVAGASTIALHSGDLWMPLAFLGSDVAVHLYIDLVAHYLYDRVLGGLHHDKPKVHVSFVFENGNGKVLRANYEGPVEGFKDCFHKVDINKMLQDD